MIIIQKQSLPLIQYKWNMGIYGLQVMVELVEENIITKKEFFEITRYNYNAISRKV